MRPSKKPPPRIDKSTLAFPVTSQTVEPRRGDSPEHCKYIRTLPCVVWGARGSQAHHLVRVPDDMGSKRGMAMRELDIYSIPMAPSPHDRLHTGPQDEAEYLLEHAGIADAPRYALKLALGSPDPEIRAYARELLK